MACRTTSSAGGFAASWCEEHATSETHATTSAVPMRRNLPITGPRLPHHCRDVIFRRPDQCDDPPDDAPSQKQIEQEDCEEVTLAAGQRNDRRQKIHDQRQAEEEMEEQC